MGFWLILSSSLEIASRVLITMGKLYTSQGSRAQIIEWYAKEKGLQFESVNVDMSRGEHKKAPFTDVNPFGKMPAIQAADGTAVFESGAILLSWLHVLANSRLRRTLEQPQSGYYMPMPRTGRLSRKDVLGHLTSSLPWSLCLPSAPSLLVSSSR